MFSLSKCARRRLARPARVLVAVGWLAAGIGAPPPVGAVELTGTIRDFQDSHPNFGGSLPRGLDLGIVASALGPDRQPVYAGPGGNVSTTDASDFDEWYRDTPGVNLGQSLTLELADPGGSGVFSFSDLDFFPIDGALLGNQGQTHNFHFTYELRGTFAYTGGEFLRVGSDDDVWVFLNGRLALDLGGVRSFTEGTVLLDDVASSLAIAPGNTYRFDLFYAERAPIGAGLLIETDLAVSDVDLDSDDDGLADSAEDANGNGVVDPGETDPLLADTDGDGVQDGTELGVTSGVPDPDGAGPEVATDPDAFQPDEDPTSTTDPLSADSDGDGFEDGNEDFNGNGLVDPGESDPTDPGSTMIFATCVEIDASGPAAAGALFTLRADCCVGAAPVVPAVPPWTVFAFVAFSVGGIVLFRRARFGYAALVIGLTLPTLWAALPPTVEGATPCGTDCTSNCGRRVEWSASSGGSVFASGEGASFSFTPPAAGVVTVEASAAGLSDRLPLDVLPGLGTPCTSDAECGSGFCSDGVCCDRACGGSCEACSAAGICEGTTGDVCGEPTFGSFGSCEGFADVCDESGLQSRTRTDFVCGSGACQPVDSTETQSCSRNTDGQGCGATSCGGFGSCGGFSSVCDETGTRSRTCTEFTCGGEVCQSSSFTDTQGCSRNTDGVSCGFNQTCSNGICQPNPCPGGCPPGEQCCDFFCAPICP